MRVSIALLASLACLVIQGCGVARPLHTQFGVAVGKNFGGDPGDFSETQAVAELGYVPGGLKADTTNWCFGGTSYLMIAEDFRPGIKAIARRHFNSQVSLDISAGPMITYNSSGLFDGFTAGVALNVSFLSLRSEFVSWPFEAWDHYFYTPGNPEPDITHHPSGHEQVWFNGVAFNGDASWLALAVITGLVIIAGANGGFD